ncbi:hypothetical protein [Paraflavitalea sp. CAU 1676]|uniref:hypothetical protein n=1 Tax=Paraflavitalea sp. CAU 1676 TaxID=3032598 RepID=UPI0023DB48F1|nr:hypothetical protein [Paraflavitalea sp. CAU 1676]
MAQSQPKAENLQINFQFFEGKIRDTSQLRLTISFHNAGNDSAHIYTPLKFGIKYDPYDANLYFEFQKQEAGGYKEYRDLNICYLLYDSAAASKPHNYLLLTPGNKLFLTYNLFDRTESVYTGKYKMRAHVLIDSKDNTYLYISSRWFEYEIIRDIYIVRNDDGSVRVNNIHDTDK